MRDRALHIVQIKCTDTCMCAYLSISTFVFWGNPYPGAPPTDRQSRPQKQRSSDRWEGEWRGGEGALCRFFFFIYLFHCIVLYFYCIFILCFASLCQSAFSRLSSLAPRPLVGPTNRRLPSVRVLSPPPYGGGLPTHARLACAPRLACLSPTRRR